MPLNRTLRREHPRPTPAPTGGIRSPETPVPALDVARPIALSTRRGAWLTLLAALIVLAALLGGLGGAKNDTVAAQVPATAESAQVDQMRDRFADAGMTSVVAVVSRPDSSPLTPADFAAARGLAADLGATSGHAAQGPIPSEDGRAAIVLVPLDRAGDISAMVATIERLRATASTATPAGTEVRLTGGAAFGADIAGAFKDADVRLLLTTIGIVALLLLITYRSPLLMLLPLIVVGVADQAAGLLGATLGSGFGWQFDAGILSVLVFGAGTNYALLLISRYREELRRRTDHRAALSAAWRGTVGAIVASNGTVVLALLTLASAGLPATRGLGLASAVGLLVAVAAVLLVLPAALAVVGRNVFWPFVPRPGGPRDDAGGVFGAVAGAVVRRPVLTLAASAAVLAVLATGLLGTRIGLTQTERFRVASESATGLEQLAAHFPAGESQPNVIMTDAGHAEQVRTAAAGVAGIVRVTPTATSTDGTLVRLSVVGAAAPDTEEAFTTVRDLRDATRAVPGASALVGGPNAVELDTRDTATADLRLIAPLILGVAFLVLAGLLRSLVAPLLLVAVNAVGALAAIGLGTWVGREFFGFPGLDSQVPLLAFLFLVALGIDYTIFLAHRIRAEARTAGTRGGTVRAVAATGGVITSAGIVLAAVFAALGVLPLVVLGQLGLIVGLGVLVDALFVRTVVVPAVFGAVGDAIWWPSRLR